MRTGILIVAHAPLASALRGCVLHVFPEASGAVAALDVPADEPAQASLATAAAQLAALGLPQTLVFADVLGATPCNVAQRLLAGPNIALVAGVNLPMLLRCVPRRGEPLDALVACALAGGAQGMVQVAAPAANAQLAGLP